MIRDDIRTAIDAAIAPLEVGGVSYVVEHPAEYTHGEYATNVALVLAKRLGKSPREVAESLVETLHGTLPSITTIEVAGPGFINFYPTRTFFSSQVAYVLAHASDWGGSTALAGEEIVIEYTSPNLFKPLHVGNLVGNIVGESLARVFSYQGGTVHRVNYPSDIGLTVAKGVWGLQTTQGDPADIHALGAAYRAGNEAYEQDPEAKLAIEAVNRALYAGNDEVLSALRTIGIATSRTHLDAICALLGTTFDAVIFESEAAPVGTALVNAHVTDGIFEVSEGATIFPGEKYGLHTRVFLNSQGLPTYEAKDLGNFTLKQERFPDWTRSFVVTGGEQREYFKVLIAALRHLFPEATDKPVVHVPTGFLTLTTGKMSSRKGNVLTGESILTDLTESAAERAREGQHQVGGAVSPATIAVAALKYQILRQSVGSDMVFDKEKALSFEGDSGPYLQYTHARIGSVLEKAAQAGVQPNTSVVPNEVYPVERLVYRFPEVVDEVATLYSPHTLVHYLIDLAASFNSLYATERIADTADEYAPYKAAVAQAVRTTLKQGLWLLGIEAPERM
jgi:arginyl-tRNA synthetase